jgi:hypothetical protein
VTATGSCDEQPLSTLHDNPSIPHIPHDYGTDDPTLEASSDFDPGDWDEHKQQDAALQAERHTRMMAMHALDQLKSDLPLATDSDSDEELGDTTTNFSIIENLKLTQMFIEDIHAATFENGGLGDNIIHTLRNPCNEATSISDPDVCLSLDLFLSITNASKQTYHACRDAILHCYPDSGILSYYSVKKLVAEITGVVAVYDDICINSCHAFTGPLSELQSCRICGEARYDVMQSMLTGKEVPQQQFCTILLGPQLQALRQSYLGAADMRYLNQKLTQVAEMLHNLEAEGGADVIYDDILSGSKLQDLVERLEITGNDTIISLSLDGAQLYQNKKSDTWISIWVLGNFSPNQHYQKKRILLRTIIPRPNKPKIINSYLYCGIHHLLALQHENNGAGLRMWRISKFWVLYIALWRCCSDP